MRDGRRYSGPRMCSIGFTASRGHQHGFILVAALVLAAVTGLTAAQAALRAQVDTRLAASAIAQAEADLYASSLLDALLDDVDALARSRAEFPLGLLICEGHDGCFPSLPRLEVQHRRLPAEFSASMGLVALDWQAAIAVPERFVSSNRLVGQRVFEARVSLSGAARAEVAAAVVILEPLAGQPP